MENNNEIKEQLTRFIELDLSSPKARPYRIYDNRLKRGLIASNGVVITITNKEVLDHVIFSRPPIPDKFQDDIKIMSVSQKECIFELCRDPQTRRAVILNTDWYYTPNRYPCFIYLHFLLRTTKTKDIKFTESGTEKVIKPLSYDLIISQRSLDVVKAYDDLCFFGFIAQNVCAEAGITVSRIIWMINNLHKEI